MKTVEEIKERIVMRLQNRWRLYLQSNTDFDEGVCDGLEMALSVLGVPDTEIEIIEENVKDELEKEQTKKMLKEYGQEGLLEGEGVKKTW